MYIPYIFIIAVLLTPIADILATAISISDIDRNPEWVCVTHGDEPGMKSVCDWINICDDNGTVNSTDEFCTGEAVRNIPYPPGGCPEGFHSDEDDETGLCYTNEKGCEYENMIMNHAEDSCSDIVDQCREEPFLKRCHVEINLGVPDNIAPSLECESSVPDHCFTPFKDRINYSNGTIVPPFDLNCDDVNATNFRVTIEDRHNFDTDYDLIGCEKEH